MTPAAYRGRKATNQNIKEIKTSCIKTTITRFTHSVTVDLVEEVPFTPQLKIHSKGGTSFKSENASGMQWKSYPIGETQIKAPNTYDLGCWRDIATIPLFSLIWLISLQPVCGVEMVGWIKGGH